jgi:hypothetical protein
VLHMSLLGEQAITDDRGGSVQVRSSRAVALVAFLAVRAGSPQSRQRIAGLLWPDSANAQALTNLRRELHHLRQVLGDEPSLVVTPRDLCWRDTKTCRVEVRVKTLAFITFCLGLADGAPLLVAATLRQDDLDEDPDLAGWIVRMRATGLLTEVPLGPLEAADTACLAQAISGQPLPEARADLLHAATGGFPLYIIEAARGSADSDRAALPVGDLAAVLRKRLDEGTAAAREVAGLAAAAGTNIDGAASRVPADATAFADMIPGTGRGARPGLGQAGHSAALRAGTRCCPRTSTDQGAGGRSQRKRN